MSRPKRPLRAGGASLWSVLAALCAFAPAATRADTVASLLGNFTINQFCGLALGADSLAVHYVVVYGQLPALRELHNADADGNGVTTQAERDAYVGTLAPAFADGLEARLDGVRVPLHATHWSSTLPNEQGGFSLRVDVDLSAELPRAAADAPRRLQFVNRNYSGRMGWHEIVVTPAPELAVYDTNAYSSSLTAALNQALQALPPTGPLDERRIDLTFDRGTAPSGVARLAPRPGAAADSSAAGGAFAAGGPSAAGSPTAAGGAFAAAGSPAAAGASTAGGRLPLGDSWIARATRRLVGAITAPHLEPGIAALALLGALLLGAVHALSPGHGKTIVGAYLIGSRGTPRHAAFLGLTVTVTHTAGVFILGFATLYASRFIVPERLFPILSLLSAVLVLGLGLVLLAQRVRGAREALSGIAAGKPPAVFVAVAAERPAARVPLVLAPSPYHEEPGAALGMHSHGGGPMHSHLPPSDASGKVTWQSLLALGISGGLVPCPSALVLLLAAVALNKTAYGMLLVLAFSVGLALTLTAVGLAFLYARNRFRRPSAAARWPHLLPVLSAGTITVVGIALCFEALRSFGS